MAYLQTSPYMAVWLTQLANQKAWRLSIAYRAHLSGKARAGLVTQYSGTFIPWCNLKSMMAFTSQGQNVINDGGNINRQNLRWSTKKEKWEKEIFKYNKKRTQKVIHQDSNQELKEEKVFYCLPIDPKMPGESKELIAPSYNKQIKLFTWAFH